MKIFKVSKVTLAIFLFEGLMVMCSFGDVIWRGTGRVTNVNGEIQVNEGDSINWSIEYEESALVDDFDEQALSMSIRFVISPSQTLRLDSSARKIDGAGLRLVNWSLSEADDLSYIDFPVDSTNTVMTMRLKGDDLIDGVTYFDLRNPSFDLVDSFFGFVNAGSKGSMQFDVDIDSIEIFERFHDSSLEISIPERGGVDLTWSVVTDARYRIETSSNLKTFFSLHESAYTPDSGVFSERNLEPVVRFYRLLRLNQIFPL